MTTRTISGLLSVFILASLTVIGGSSVFVWKLLEPTSITGNLSYRDELNARKEILNEITKKSSHARNSRIWPKHEVPKLSPRLEIPEGMIWHIVFDFTKKIEEKGEEADVKGERASLFTEYFTRQGPLSVQHDLILKQKASEYFVEIGPINNNAEKTAKEYRNTTGESLMHDLRALQAQKDIAALRFRDQIVEHFGESSFAEFETFVKGDFMKGAVRHDSTQTAAPGSFFYFGFSWILWDETQAPTLITGFSELYFSYYAPPYFWDPFLESFFVSYTSQQVLHAGFDYGFEDIFPARYYHPVFVSVVGHTYCTATDHYAYFWPNLLNPESWRYSFLDFSYACHTVNAPPTSTPTPTPTPTPAPSPTPCFALGECIDYSAQIESVGFGGDIPIKRFATQTDITDPTWRRGDVGNSRNYVAYRKDADPNSMNLSATLRVSPTPTGPLNARVRVKYAGSEVAGPTGDIPVSGDIINIPSLEFTSPLEEVRKVKKGIYDLIWEVSFNNGQTWEPSGSSQHPIYWTYGEVFEPANCLIRNCLFVNDFGRTGWPGLFDLALEKAIDELPKDPVTNDPIAQTPDEIANQLAWNIDDQIVYNPGTIIPDGVHPLRAYSFTGGVQCAVNANLLRGLLRSIGIKNSEAIYVWGGKPDRADQQETETGGKTYGFKVNLRSISTGGTGFFYHSMQAIRPASNEGGISLLKDPYFTFHAMVKVFDFPDGGPNNLSARYYDPSYAKRLRANRRGYPDYPYINSNVMFKRAANLDDPDPRNHRWVHDDATKPFVVRALVLNSCLPNDGNVCDPNPQRSSGERRRPLLLQPRGLRSLTTRTWRHFLSGGHRMESGIPATLLTIKTHILHSVLAAIYLPQPTTTVTARRIMRSFDQSTQRCISGKAILRRFERLFGAFQRMSLSMAILMVTESQTLLSFALRMEPE